MDPTVRLDIESETTGSRIIVLSDAAGKDLLIDDVHQVETVEPEAIDTSAATETKGVIRRDDRIVIRVEPAAWLG